MTATKNTTKQNSSKVHEEIRQAKFESAETSVKNKRFKYMSLQRLNIKNKNYIVNLKRRINTLLQKPSLWASMIDWKIVKKDSIEWGLEVIIEGVPLNFATHFLFGVPLNPMTVIAHGIVIKKGISIYWRLRRDGTDSKIPKKNE
jgi:hypothetical protein